MKKNKKRILLIALLLLLIVFMVLLGRGSYSKYLTQVKGKGVIEVAKWAFLVNGETASITNINLAKTYTAETLAQNTIAPGTRGSFDIKIDTTGSEVGINYDVKFENENSKPQNLQYTYNGNTIATNNKKYVIDMPYNEGIQAYMATQIELDKAIEFLI